MKKVLFLSYYWPPSGGPGVQRGVKFVKYLPSFGIEPIVVTVDPSVASYPFTDTALARDIPPLTRVITTKSFEPLGLYQALRPDNSLPKPGFSGEGKPGLPERMIRFIRGNFFVPDARKGWNRYALKACRDLLKKEDFAAIMTTSPPHSTQLIGLKLKKEFGLPWIADLRDPWTDIYYISELRRMKPAVWADERWERMVLERADQVITVSETIKALFAAKSVNVDIGKIHVIPNGFDPDDFPDRQAMTTKKRDPSQPFVIGYTGTLSDAYQTDGFVRAVIMFAKKHPKALLQVRFTGQVSQSIRQIFHASGLTNTLLFDGYVNHDQAIKAMNESDVLLLIIPDVKHNEGILTGKLFEYLATNRPILGFGPPEGDAAKILKESKKGQMFSYTDWQSAGNYLSALFTEQEDLTIFDARKNIPDQYNRKKQTESLASIIMSVHKLHPAS